MSTTDASVSVPIVQEGANIEVDKAFINIREMRVHGAGRIAQLAAAALGDFTKSCPSKDRDDLYKCIIEAGQKLKSARPTAVSLPNAVNFVLLQTKEAYANGSSIEGIRGATISAAEQFVKESGEAMTRIGEIGAKRIRNGDTILTHCNSEAAISVLKTAHDQGKGIKVFNTETRPKHQGHKTAVALAKHGIEVTMIVDSAVRLFMDDIDKVVVGADAITVNGAVVNKIGTSQIATLAHESRVKMMVAAETFKFNPQTIYGDLVEIEERDPTEVAPKELLDAYPALKIKNPVFDITPPEYIDLIITEKGLVPPAGVYLMMKDLFNIP